MHLLLDPYRTDAPGRKVLTKNVEDLKQVVVTMNATTGPTT